MEESSFLKTKERFCKTLTYRNEFEKFALVSEENGDVYLKKERFFHE